MDLLGFLRRASTDEIRARDRFRKLFAEQLAEFDAEIGRISADHAARGLLKSGATIKRGYREMDVALGRAVDDGLRLISNKTEGPGRKRKRLLNLLRKELYSQSDEFLNLGERKIVGVAGAGASANNAARRLFRENLKRRADQIDKYDEGLTAPTATKRHERHPIWVNVIGGLLVAGILWIISLVAGGLKLPAIIQGYLPH